MKIVFCEGVTPESMGELATLIEDADDSWACVVRPMSAVSDPGVGVLIEKGLMFQLCSIARGADGAYKVPAKALVCSMHDVKDPNKGADIVRRILELSDS